MPIDRLLTKFLSFLLEKNIIRKLYDILLRCGNKVICLIKGIANTVEAYAEKSRYFIRRGVAGNNITSYQK